MAELRLKNGGITLVDEEDLPLVSQFTWYGVRDGDRTYVQKIGGSLHRLIMGKPEGLTIDHINGDTLDNRKANLRICTVGENVRNRRLNKDNTSGFKGVWRRANNRFQAEIRFNGKKKRLGCYGTPQEAARAYNDAAKTLFGEFANLNPV